MNNEIKTALDSWISRFQAIVSGEKVISYTVGRRWIRVVCALNMGEHERGYHSALCFVDPQDGTIYKAAGWKGPTRNFTRGNVCSFDDRRFMNYGHINGC